MQSPEANIPVMRHFDDIDDLLSFGRDGDLIPGQEEQAAPIAQEIDADVKKEGKGAVMFVCSSKRRAIQTADLIADQLHKLDDKIKVRVTKDEALDAIYQGEFILPADYKPGDKFLGLELAGRAFAQEALVPDKGNYLYKFGDPVLQDDKSYKYPELVPYFKSYGESNRDLLLRIYDLVVRASEQADKLNSRTKVVAVTHSQLYQVFRDLNTVANMVKDDGFELKTGELPKLCWDLYSERFKREKPTYALNYVSIENLCDPAILGLLKKEIEFLKELK